MKISARMILFCCVASMLMAAGISFFLYNRSPLYVTMLLALLFIAAGIKAIQFHTGLKCAKKNLDEAQQLASLGSWERDLRTGRGYWSENRYRLFGLQQRKTAPSLEEFYGFIHDADRNRARETVATAISTGGSYEVRYRLADDKANRIFLSRGKVQRDDSGKAVAIVGTTQDITEKELQEHLLQELITQKDTFITRLGHDLKTPLTPLVTLLPIIRSRATDDKERELIDICINNANHIKDVVVKTIQLARLTSIKMPMDAIGAIKLASAVDGYTEKIAGMFPGQSVTFENTIPDNIVVQADSRDLEELFYNLLGNAVKFSSPDSRVGVCAAVEQGMVTITVKDNGIGLSPEEQDHIFDELYKADPSRHELSSSGLGLVICRQIIENHGGRIWADSPGKGGGTSVHFTLAAGGIA